MRNPSRRLFFILFFLFLATLISNCAPGETQFGIIFSAKLQGNQDVYRAGSQGFQSLERLTHSPDVAEKDLKITRDGKKLLYSVQGHNLGRGTYLLDLEKNQTSELNDDAMGLRSIVPLTLSPAGNQVVILEEQVGKIYSLDLDTKRVNELVIPRTFNFSIISTVDYSPDGKRIAFTEQHNPTPPSSTKSSFIYNFESKPAIPLFENTTATCDHPKWSPNGEQILLACDLSEDGIKEDVHVYLFDLKKDHPGAIKEIADLPCGAHFAWSPDGQQFITANCRMDKNFRSLMIFNHDGSVNRELNLLDASENPLKISEIVWSPDGKKILYIAGEREDALNIYIVNSDGADNHAITAQPANYEELSVFKSIP